MVEHVTVNCSNMWCICSCLLCLWCASLLSLVFLLIYNVDGEIGWELELANNTIIYKLSHAGRVTLIKLVFASLPIYYMATTLLPKKITAKLTSIIRTFWWTVLDMLWIGLAQSETTNWNGIESYLDLQGFPFLCLYSSLVLFCFEAQREMCFGSSLCSQWVSVDRVAIES